MRRVRDDGRRRAPGPDAPCSRTGWRRRWRWPLLALGLGGLLAGLTLGNGLLIAAGLVVATVALIDGE